MNHKYHTELKKAGFAYQPGKGCDCKDSYIKPISESVVVIIRKEKCGKQLRRCKWELVLIERGKGQVGKAYAESDFVTIQNQLETWTQIV